MVVLVLVSAPVGLSVAQDSGADTNVDNAAPSVDSVTTPTGGMSPGAAETFDFSISDDNGVNTIKNVTIDLYRSDTGPGSSLSARKHYEIIYNPDTQSATISPTTYSTNDDPSSNIGVTVVDNLDDTSDASTSGSFTLDITIADDAAPSQSVNGDNSTTVNGYTWRVRTIAYDEDGASGSLTVDSEVSPLINIALNATAISTNGAPDTNQTYSPALLSTNKGNVQVNIDYNATNQTSGSTSDKINATRLYVDNQTYSTPTDGVSNGNQYSTSFQTLATETRFDSDETLSNWVWIPPAIDTETYSGNVTYSPQMSGAR